SGGLWNALQFFGGLAAPTFLALAGLSLGIQWGRTAERGTPFHPAKHIARGLQLIVFGYALRLQMWVIDAGGYSRPGNYLAILSLLLAFVLAHQAAEKLATAPRRAAKIAGAAAAAWLIGAGIVRIYEPARLRGLLRVDVLQCIGASLVGLNLLALLHARRRAGLPGIAVLLLAAAAIGLAVAPLRELAPGALPEAIAAYFAQWPTADGAPVAGLFPLLPWAGFACGGAALGLWWTRAQGHSQLEVRIIASIAIGAWLALCTSEAWPPVYRLARDHAWLAPLLRLAYKFGLVLALLGPALALSRVAGSKLSPKFLVQSAPLQTLGSSSLLVYWVHLEFAFGAAARPLVRKLELPAWALGTTLLVCAMWLLVTAVNVGTARGAARSPRGTATTH
ncbi:MAG: hypothetical protein RLZZ450_7330, partial [Pseudomonadota bacterium]